MNDTDAPADPPAVAPPAARRIDQIVELAAQGFTDKEISQQLGMSKNTVDTHWKRLRERLGVRSRTAAVMASLRQTVERQSNELREANAALEQMNQANRDGLGALLAVAEKRLAETRTLAREQTYHRDYFERASHMARFAVYDLASLTPVAHRYVSPSVSAFGHDAGAMVRAETMFYDIIHPEDLHRMYEQSLGVTYRPDERHVYFYRMRMPDPRWVMDTHQAVFDDNGDLLGVLGMVVDVEPVVQAGLLHPTVTRLVVPAPPLAPSPEIRTG